MGKDRVELHNGIVDQADLFEKETVLVKEVVTNSNFVERVRELEARNARFWRVKVLNHSAGYEIECRVDGG